MINWKRINAGRIRDGDYATTDTEGCNGAFGFRINGLPIRVIASDGEGWKHVSVSIQGSTSTPSWSIMCQIKELFWDDEDWVIQFHPAKSEYVNNHPGCLHLWQPLGVELPKPDSLMVGYK